MDNNRRRSVDRRGVQSLFIPLVPKIVLSATETQDAVSNPMSHSRSAGELCVDGESEKEIDGAVFRSCNGANPETQKNIEIYCSPRLQRRSLHLHSGAETDNENIWLDTLDSSNSPTKLGPGSRVGSTVSLTSEYTARSIGLISNDSSSDSTQFSDKIEHIKQKQNLLRRYVSNPEKPPSENSPTSVQRSTKSVNNIHLESNQSQVMNESESESMDSSVADYGNPPSVHEQLKQLSNKGNYNLEGDDTLVTMITDDMVVKEGRIRQWLTDIGVNDS